MTRTFLLSLALAAAVLIAGCGKIDVGTIGDVIGGPGGQLIKAGGREMSAESLSQKDEDAIGQSVGVTLTSTYGLTKDPRLARYVMLVGLTVASASPNPGGNWVFGVLDTPEVNAFSGPNGYVFITRGCIARMHDEAELAGVLAHEISHVCHHDGLHQVQAAERQGALADALRAGTQDQQFAALVDSGVDAITKEGYTQPQEFAADQSGVEIMSAAGYDPASYLRFLQRLQTEGAATGAGQVMSTHPAIGKRVVRVANQLKTIRPGGATLAGRFDANVPAGLRQGH
jgi:predicted Zn-dependent protease